jgi:hypothetical protein
MRNINLQSTAALATVISVALAARPAMQGNILQQRQDFLCPVVCDQTWCCLTGQTCQEASAGDAPFECADPLFETTESAFALGPLLTAVESIVSENNEFISSITAALSLTLTFPSVTALPDPPEETTPSQRPTPTEPSVPSTTTIPETGSTQESTPSSGNPDVTSTQQAPSSTETSDADTTEEETPSSLETSDVESTITTSTRSGSSVSTGAGSTRSFDPIPTSALPAAAPKVLSPWQHGIVALGMAMAVVW